MFPPGQAADACGASMSSSKVSTEIDMTSLDLMQESVEAELRVGSEDIDAKVLATCVRFRREIENPGALSEAMNVPQIVRTGVLYPCFSGCM